MCETINYSTIKKVTSTQHIIAITVKHKSFYNEVKTILHIFESRFRSKRKNKFREC